MVMTDPIADMLTRIRNANMAEHIQVDIPSSRMKGSIAQILKEEGYIKDYKVVPDTNQGILRVYLTYGPHREKVITGIRKITKPGRRVYSRSKDIPDVLNRLGICIVSTSKGLMTGENAKKLNLGGELICEVW
ncbi:30S ribosomal protein S8 [bacterium]|nr:30S ribosomal protein S8 [bacterium]